MKTLYIVYSESREGGYAINPDENFSDRTPETIDVTFKCLLRRQRPNKMFYHSVEVSDKTYKSGTGYLAVVKYSSGDTFGHSSGHWHVVGCTGTYATAERLLEMALKDPKGYKPWEGYFESLEGTEIHPLPIS